jgi:hypothetical protein
MEQMILWICRRSKLEFESNDAKPPELGEVSVSMRPCKEDKVAECQSHIFSHQTGRFELFLRP